MTLNYLKTWCILSLAICTLSCSSDSTGPGNEQYITGVVKDLNGRPVANAYLNMFYTSVLPPGFHKEAKTLPTTTIDIDIPRRGYLVVRIENYIHQTVKHLFADTVASGVQGIDWNFKDDIGRGMYTDCYWATATLDDSLLSSRKMLAVDFQYNDSIPAPFALTDWTGKFSIPFSRLPLHETFTTTDWTSGAQIQVRIGPTDRLYAFNQWYYGCDSITYSHPHDLVIFLSHAK